MTPLAVAGLIGDDLNIAVAFADGHRVRRSTIAHAPGIHEQWPGGNWEWIRQPSTAWEHGGPIIERERIALEFLDGEWRARAPRKLTAGGDVGQAAAPLIAAMRAYVASTFGKTIALDELLAGVSPRSS